MRLRFALDLGGLIFTRIDNFFRHNSIISKRSIVTKWLDMRVLDVYVRLLTAGLLTLSKSLARMIETDRRIWFPKVPRSPGTLAVWNAAIFTRTPMLI